MPLHHIHIPSLPPNFPTYALAVEIQSRLQARLHAYKSQLATPSTPTSRAEPAPPPTLLTFTPAPTYTLGRRQTSPLGSAEEARLRAPLAVRHRIPRCDADKDDHEHGNDVVQQTVTTIMEAEALGRRASPSPRMMTSTHFAPAVIAAPRGGLTTYHGPGQLVFWPVIDLRSPLHRHLTVRDYACLLEKTTIASLARATSPSPSAATASSPHPTSPLPPSATDGVARQDALSSGEGGRRRFIEGFTDTENPGVWVRHDPYGLWGESRDATAKTDERKIAALGVHLRRHVTGLGVAVNVTMPVSGGEEVNPWGRIVACGIEGKGVTSVAAELLGDTSMGSTDEREEARMLEGIEERLRALWAEEFSRRLFQDSYASDGGIIQSTWSGGEEL